MSARVCLCVCLSAIMSSELRVRSSLIFCACCLWSWRCSRGTLRLPGFVDDVVCAYKLRLLVALVLIV